jgi:hypothetical protein
LNFAFVSRIHVDIIKKEGTEISKVSLSGLVYASADTEVGRRGMMRAEVQYVLLSFLLYEQQCHFNE